MINGEYWVKEDGDVDYADGDMGEWNHEGIVIDLVRHEIADIFNIYLDEYHDWDEVKQEIIEKYLEDLDENELKKYSQYYDDGEWDYHSLIDDHFEDILKENGINEETISIAEDQGDARAYALEHWGWKAVRGDNVETWELKPEDFDAIYTGLGEILEQEGIDEWDHPDEELEVSIYNYSTGRSNIYSLADIQRAAKGQRPSYLPTKMHIDPETYGQAVSMSAREREKSKLHPYYQKRTFPFGDSYYPKGVVTFMEWLKIESIRWN